MRAVEIALESHGAHTAVQFKLPEDVLGLEIHDGDGLRLDGAADGELSVGGDVDVVHAGVHGNGFCERERAGIDEVERAGKRANADDDAAAVFGDGDVVGPPGKGNFAQNFARLRVDHIEDAFRFIADVNARAVGRKVNAVGQFDAANDLDDFISCGVDDVDGVRGAVGDVDARGRWGHTAGRGAF